MNTPSLAPAPRPARLPSDPLPSLATPFAEVAVDRPAAAGGEGPGGLVLSYRIPAGLAVRHRRAHAPGRGRPGAGGAPVGPPGLARPQDGPGAPARGSPAGMVCAAGARGAGGRGLGTGRSNSEFRIQNSEFVAPAGSGPTI